MPVMMHDPDFPPAAHHHEPLLLDPDAGGADRSQADGMVDDVEVLNAAAGGEFGAEGDGALHDAGGEGGVDGGVEVVELVAAAEDGAAA